MKRIGLLSVVLGLIIISYSNALACVCMVRPTDEKDIKKAIIAEYNYVPLVFSGRLIAAEYVPTIKNDDSGKEIEAEALVYRFSIDKLWKGNAQGEVILNTDVFKYNTTTHSTSCDANFKVGQQYLVYAAPDSEGKLQRNVCGRTNLIKSAKTDIKEIQKLSNKMKH